ncbi:putative O-methyltransferase YrrM [Deinococcus sp. HSC-46F16]|uniref:NUDIX domain-containing protein n=1 Tax=Deinococcus sp. HSC-46F16 TaxID=2910968 RepID=UPI0020A093CF|nr:NUDIX domain-containing protein [Deinococcus sp. HSC-46F16]MCP2015373.1 putative O-methyltransferase YrrM [Deinococcus sp. HSC-46F16]
MKSFVNLSPSPTRVGRACAWIEQEDGRVLMTGLEWGGWTLPGGGVHPGETAAQAAVREAWEEAGARCEVAGDPVPLRGASGVDAECFPLRLLALEPSPEGRPVAWVNPRSLPWADDVQLRQVLAARGETPQALALPPLVARAVNSAEAHGFPHSCSFETGRLLRTLAASRPGGRMLELGSGWGVGTAWLLSGLDTAAGLVTVDVTPACAEAVASLLAGDPRAEVRCADWRDALTAGPFDLIFVDCAPAKGEESLDALVDALRPGGLLVVDDLSPPAFLPERMHGGDPLREALYAQPRLLCTEVSVSRRESVVLATRTA